MIDSLLTALSFPFIQRALLAGLITGVTTAFLSVFITLRNMSFYADAISHSALAGIAIGVLFGFAPFPTAVVFCVLLAVLTVYLKNKSTVSVDTLMGVLFASGISLGVALISQLSNFRTDLFTYLFGDILAVTRNDIIVAALLAVVIILYLMWTGKQLLLITFSRDFSRVRDLPIRWLDYSFFIATALTIALSIKIIGLILVTGLLILPAAIAKNIAGSFKQMVLLALACSMFSTIIGLVLSYFINLPSGPAIILVGTFLFIVATIARRR